MHEIFISYSSRHRDLTRDLAERLQAQHGADSVWWDVALEARGPYQPQIQAALDAARVVLVIWTTGAQISEYVYAEAVRAHAAHKLINLRPVDTAFNQIPEPFSIHHIEPLAATERILLAVAQVMAGQPMPTAVPLDELYNRHHGQPVLDPKQQPLPTDLADIAPSQLLQARHQQTGYLDATGLRQQMLQWALHHPRPAAGRVLHGPGGIGKTRLLIEVAATLRSEHGWQAGFVEPPADSQPEAMRQQWRQALQQRVQHGNQAGLLLVVDYAESHRSWLDELVAWIIERPAPPEGTAPTPIRLVLLMRQAGEGWERRRDESDALSRMFRFHPDWPPEVALLPFIDATDRLTLYRSAWAWMGTVAQAQGFAPPPEPTDEALTDQLSGDEPTPLAIQMAALVTLCAAAGPQARDWHTGALLDRVLALEGKHWQRRLGTLDEAATTALQRGLAQLTLVQGCAHRAEAERLLMADGYYGLRRQAPVDVAPVLNQLQRLYGQGEGLMPLQPDLLGEHLVCVAADHHTVDACVAWLPGPSPAGQTPTSSSEAPGVQDAAAHALVTVLQRATRDGHGNKAQRKALVLAEHLLRHHLQQLARTVVETLISTPGQLHDLLTTILNDLPEADLLALEAAFPQSSLALADTMVEVGQGLVSHARNALRIIGREDNQDSSPPAAELARRLNNMGNRLSDLGRQEDALAATQEAIELRRQLAHARPDAFFPDLASSLNNLGTVLSALGCREDALAATQEAVDLYRPLARARPDAYLPELAPSLNNLGSMFSALGRLEDALAASQEAVEFYRQLTRTQPEAFLPELATSLSNLGNKFSALGRSEDALAASHEAVELYRPLARAQPDAFLPELAASLNNLGTVLSALGRLEDALATTQEAIEFRRQLACARPDAFLSDLAGSLINLGLALSALGRLEDALAASQEAVELYRPLARARPDTFLPELATSLNNMGTVHSALGHLEDTLAASQEAVELYRQLARARPDAFSPDLASSLNNLGNGLAALGSFEEALAASQEAVELYRQLAHARPDAFLPDLASSLNNMGPILSGLGRLEDALAASQGAIELYRQLAHARPDALLPYLATSLNNLGVMLSALGRLEDALAPCQEAVELRRQLAHDRPDALLPDLATSLNNLSVMLFALGRLKDALATSQEAVELYRKLARVRPNAFLPALAGSLNNLGISLSKLGRREDALAATQEAVDLRRQLARARPDAFTADLSTSLGAQSMALAAAGRHEDASAASGEGLRVLLPLLTRLPQALAQLAKDLARNHIQQSQAAGLEPDLASLSQVTEILGLGQPSAPPDSPA